MPRYSCVDALLDMIEPWNAVCFHTFSDFPDRAQGGQHQNLTGSFYFFFVTN